MRIRITLVCCVCATALAASSLSATELPEGFRLEPVVGNLTEPSALADTSDGRILIAERKSGDLLQMRWGQLQDDPLCSVEVDSSGEGGLLGVAVHPGFRQTGWVYLYYTSLATGKNKVTRFTVDLHGCFSPMDIYSDLGSGPTLARNGGALGFGQDGKLYVATGDMELEGNAQDPGAPQGKVLRVNADGTDSEVYAMGVRDGRGLTINPDGRVYLADRGNTDQAVYDESHTVAQGGNLGWPEESGAGGSHDQPLVSWLPTVGIGGIVDYDGELFPDAAADGLDNDHDSYGPDGYPGLIRWDDNELGECVGGKENNGGPCSSLLDCLPGRENENPRCEMRDDRAEYCPAGVALGDDDCDDLGGAGIDEPDESFRLDVFMAADAGIQRASLVGTENDQLGSWETFLDSDALTDCPTMWTGLMSGRDGHLYALATNGGAENAGALYRVIYDGAAGPREVSGPDSYAPLRLDKGNLGAIEFYWEDLRRDAMQVQKDGNTLLAPAREYTIWQGQIGMWDDHDPFVPATTGTAVNGMVRKVTVFEAYDNGYFLISATSDNLRGKLGSGDMGERTGSEVTDICDDLGTFNPSWTLFNCGADLTLVDTHGIERQLHDYRGRPVLMDLSTMWCPGCGGEADVLQDFYKEFEDRGVRMVTVLLDDDSSSNDYIGSPTPGECRDWEDRSGSNPDHTFDCWVDPIISCTTNAGERCIGNVVQQAWPLYRVNYTIPRNILLDQGLRVVWTQAGWSDNIENTVRDRLHTLVGATDTCLH